MYTVIKQKNPNKYGSGFGDASYKISTNAPDQLVQHPILVNNMQGRDVKHGGFF